MIIRGKKSVRPKINYSLRYCNVYLVWYVCRRRKDTLGPPRGPAIVKWVKNYLELSWQPPSEVTITNDLQYIIEVEQNHGNWSTLGVSHEPRLLLLHLDAAKAHNFRIFVKNKVGTSEPLILEDVKIPLNHLGLAIEEVFDDNTTNNLGQYVKIEEVFSDPEEENYEFQKIEKARHYLAKNSHSNRRSQNKKVLAAQVEHESLDQILLYLYI